MVYREQVNASVMDFDEKVFVRPLTFYGWMLAAAARHCVPHKLTGPDLNEIGLTWVITHFTVEWQSFPDWTHTLTVETWARDRKGFKTRRDYRIMTADGQPAALGASSWCLLDLTTRKPVPMEKVADRMMECLPEEAIQGWRTGRLEGPSEDHGVKEFPEHRVSYGDLDFNDHCTNMRYVEWAWNALPVDFQRARRPFKLDVQFVNEAFAGDILTVVSETTGSETRQILTNQDGSQEYCRLVTHWRDRNKDE